MSFVFFDTETTGLHAGFDQIVQFAAIKTDNDLNETDRLELRARINPHVVPNIQAMLANGLSIKDLTDQRLPTHFQMIGDLNARLVSWSPAIFLGYNSIRFDEEFLRQALYQTLHPPYLTSLHGNGRNDIMSLALACSASDNGALRVPLNESGNASFRLHDLAAANGITALKAHDALSDTETAIEICRLVRKSSPDLWSRFVRFSKKASVADFISSEEPFILTEFFSNRAYHTPVVFVANEPTPPNGMLCLNLSVQINDLASFSDEELVAKLSTPPSPIRRIRANSGPTLTPLWEASEQHFEGLSSEELEDRATQISEDDDLKIRLAESYLKTSAEYPEPTHVEEMLYTKFSSRNDVELCSRFHEASWSEKLNIGQSFQDDRLRELALRVSYFECRSSLPTETVQKMDLDLAHRLMSFDEKPPSVEKELRHVDEVRSNLLEEDVEETRLMESYAAFLAQRRSRILKFLDAK